MVKEVGDRKYNVMLTPGTTNRFVLQLIFLIQMYYALLGLTQPYLKRSFLVLIVSVRVAEAAGE